MVTTNQPPVEEAKLGSAGASVNDNAGSEPEVQEDANTGSASEEALQIVDVVLTEFSNRGFFNLDNVQYDLLQTIKGKAAKRVDEFLGEVLG